MQKTMDQQHSFLAFARSMNIEMQEDNRWVKLSKSVPWHRLEEHFPMIGTETDCQMLKSFRVALVICIIQAKYDCPDKEAIQLVQENPFLQYFCGFEQYQQELPITESTMMYFKKHLTLEVLEEINRFLMHPQ